MLYKFLTFRFVFKQPQRMMYLQMVNVCIVLEFSSISLSSSCRLFWIKNFIACKQISAVQCHIYSTKTHSHHWKEWDRQRVGAGVGERASECTQTRIHIQSTVYGNLPFRQVVRALFFYYFGRSFGVFFFSLHLFSSKFKSGRDVKRHLTLLRLVCFFSLNKCIYWNQYLNQAIFFT